MKPLRCRTLFAAMLFSVIPAACQMNNTPQQSPVGPHDGSRFSSEDHLWKHRPLLIFAPDEKDPMLAEQRRILAEHTAGVRDRDMVIVEFVDPSDGSTAEVRRNLNAEFRERFNVNSNRFRVLLLGKDGTEKLRSFDPVTSGELFQRIDAMPMRRQEMRQQR